MRGRMCVTNNPRNVADAAVADTAALFLNPQVIIPPVGAAGPTNFHWTRPYPAGQLRVAMMRPELTSHPEPPRAARGHASSNSTAAVGRTSTCTTGDAPTCGPT